MRLHLIVHLAEEHHVLPADDVQAQRHVCVRGADNDPLDSRLEYDVGKLVKRTHLADDLTAVAQHH
eukprot:CAMPEP_0174727182 /NCGR_PEP_ID=MMETSP1094-20130205/49259_1 /TAXON_ID=156173 /ORGANISM="Chrysochromulina brevifilum, Strain UTEX LB 985" /LENGTH=65 /DNA_ID=CAMNT_0015928867 /DNA_START=234 /DNA_END=431 /DNA_ORIENTATION=-